MEVAVAVAIEDKKPFNRKKIKDLVLVFFIFSIVIAIGIGVFWTISVIINILESIQTGLEIFFEEIIRIFFGVLS